LLKYIFYAYNAAMTNSYNKKQAELARKRRAIYYRLHANGISGPALARRFGISHQRMSFMLRQAAKEALK